MELNYPLPSKNLKSRYKSFFKNIERGFSGSLISMNKAPKSGYLKFILENKTAFSDILPRKTKIIYFEPMYTFDASILSFLAQLNTSIQFQDSLYKPEFTENTSLILSNIQKYIYTNYNNGFRTCFILNKINDIEGFGLDVAQVLMTLFNTLRNTPNNACCIYFLLNQTNVERDNLSLFLTSLIYPLRESIEYFPELNREETKYTIERLCKIYSVKTESNIDDIVYQYTGGNYSLIFDFVQIALMNKMRLTKKFIINEIPNNPIIIKYITSLLENISIENRISLIKHDDNKFVKNLGLVNRQSELKSKLISDFVDELGIGKIINPKEGVFSENEKLVVEKLKQNINKLVLKDDLINLIWSTESEKKYSLWALDKFVSRLRRKINISMPGFRLVAVRKKGVMLCQ